MLVERNLQFVTLSKMDVSATLMFSSETVAFTFALKISPINCNIYSSSHFGIFSKISLSIIFVLFTDYCLLHFTFQYF